MSVITLSFYYINVMKKIVTTHYYTTDFFQALKKSIIILESVNKKFKYLWNIHLPSRYLKS